MNDQRFRTGLSLGILGFLLGGPASAGLLFLLLELLGQTQRYGKWIISISMLMVFVFPLALWKRGKIFLAGYYAGVVCCAVIVYLSIRLLAWVMAR